MGGVKNAISRLYTEIPVYTVCADAGLGVHEQRNLLWRNGANNERHLFGLDGRLKDGA